MNTRNILNERYFFEKRYFQETVSVFAFCDSSLKTLFLLRAEEKQLFRQKVQRRPKKPAWNNHTARGSGKGYCSPNRCIFSTVEAIETSTITVVSIP